MQTRSMGPFKVSAISLGCMNLSHAYAAPVSAEQGERMLLAALGAGVTMFDSADVMARLQALINENTVAGNRYSEQSNREVDTEVFQTGQGIPLSA